MSLPTNHINDYLVASHEHMGGLRGIYRFPNGYGASVIAGGIVTAHRGDNYIELAVLRFEEGSEDYDLCYDTPITDDVEILSNEKDLINMLLDIKRL
ncbi:hypothetical protein BVL54_19750 [Bacillus paralicheniformis]|nr:hypothetical protein BVL54_19750 [Bacillus paralicheniformis]